MSHWYLGLNGVQVGPLEESDVRARLASGEISRATLGWRAGMKDWAPLGQTELVLRLVEQVPPTEAPDVGAPEAAYGNFGARALAFFLDSAIVGTAVIALAYVTGMVVAMLVPELEEANAILRWLAPIISLSTNFFYFGVVQALLEGSPGKHALGLRLVRVDYRPIGVGTGIFRYIMRVVVTVPLGLGLFAVAWNKRRQGWHDSVCRTLVVSRDWLAYARRKQELGTSAEQHPPATSAGPGWDQDSGNNRAA